MRFGLSLGVAAALSIASIASAAIVGTNLPAQPLTPARVASVESRLQPAWREYLKRSDMQRQADKALLEAELRAGGISEPVSPPEGKGAASIPLRKPSAWYGGSEGLRIGDIILSFQTPAGGWSKNLDMSKHPRRPGEAFAHENASRYPGGQDFDNPREPRWNYVGTIDNDATMTQLRYLAKVVSALRPEPARQYQAAFLRGLEYLFAAQYPNGGWPQVWPLQGGYHDAITFNDDAMINVLGLLRDASEGRSEFAFVPDAFRTRAADAVRRGIDCILDCQVFAGGRLAVWCQQHDPLSRQPTSARNYEMPSLASAESAQIALFLMRVPEPTPRITASVRAAAAWFEKTAIHDQALENSGPEGRHLVARPGAELLWSRYYEIGSDRPIFGDRDKTIHDEMAEISRERRQGYGWYRTSPQRFLEQFKRWTSAPPAALPARAPLRAPGRERPTADLKTPAAKPHGRRRPPRPSCLCAGRACKTPPWLETAASIRRLS